MKVSVIIPMYNAHNTLKRCLDSVVSQKFDSFEVILIDDGSQDDTYEIARGYADQYPVVSCYKKNNGGVSSARNYGLSKARGEYITFMDNDDEYEPEYFQRIKDYLQDDLYDIVVASITNITENGEIKKAVFDCTLNREVFAQSYYKYHKDNYLMTVWNKFFKSELLQNIEFEEGRINGEDYLFCLNCYSKCRNIRFVPVVGYRFYNLENSASHRLYKRYDPQHELDNSIKWRHQTDSLLRKIGVNQEEIEKNHQKKDALWFYNMVKNIMNPGTPYTTRKQKIEQIRKIMDVEECRKCILRGDNTLMGRTVKALYRINSARLTYFVFNVISKQK